MIYFYNKNREIVMELNKFSSDNEQETRIKFSANISYAFYKASREIEDFKFYLEDFLKKLKLLYDNEIETAQFVPIERQLEIYFRQLKFGHIAVSIKLNYFDFDQDMYQSMLIINYKIDQSFLPELIEEINSVINNE